MDQFSYIANADVAALDALYQQYKENPTYVDESWQNFFKGFEFNQTFNGAVTGTPAAATTGTSVSAEHTRKEMEVVHLIRGYRSRGHLLSNINPIGGRRDRQKCRLINKARISSETDRE